MKITVITSFFTIGNMNIDSSHMKNNMFTIYNGKGILQTDELISVDRISWDTMEIINFIPRFGMENIREIEQWSRFHAIGLLLGLVTYFNLHMLWIMPLISLVSFGYLVFGKRRLFLNEDYTMSRANMVTLGRHDLLVLVTFLSAELDVLIIGSVAIIIALLDILDGHLARKDNNATLVGEYLDKEVDGVFVLLMSCVIYHFELLPAWILVLGALRYIYVLILPYLKSENRKEYRSKYGRVIAVILMIGLIGCFFIRHPYYEMLMMAVALLVLTSFLRSLWHWIYKPTSAS